MKPKGGDIEQDLNGSSLDLVGSENKIKREKENGSYQQDLSISSIGIKFQTSNLALNPLPSVVDAGDPMSTSSLLGLSWFQLEGTRSDGLVGYWFALESPK